MGTVHTAAELGGGLCSGNPENKEEVELWLGDGDDGRIFFFFLTISSKGRVCFPPHPNQLTIDLLVVMGIDRLACHPSLTSYSDDCRWNERFDGGDDGL